MRTKILIATLIFLIPFVVKKIYADTIQSVKSNTVFTKVGNPRGLPPAGVGVQTSCLVVGGKITTPSYQANPTTGHCGGGYSYSCDCKTEGVRAKAIDVSTNNQDVVLPTIEGQTVRWRIVSNYPTDDDEGGGAGYTFEAILGSDKWYLDMVHLGKSSLSKGIDYPSGTVVGKTVIDHVHTTIGKNILDSTHKGNPVTDCDPGWIPSDFMCK